MELHRDTIVRSQLNEVPNQGLVRVAHRRDKRIGYDSTHRVLDRVTRWYWMPMHCFLRDDEVEA